jgi:biopolymer transport protein ExbB
MRTVISLLLLGSSCFGYSWRAQVDLGTATSGTLNNITLATVTIADSHLKTIANGGTINDATCTHTIANVPCDFYITDNSSCGVSAAPFRFGFESYDGTAGTARLWVLVPAMTAPTHVVPYVCTGDPSIHTYQGGSAGAEFDASTQGAWHFPDGTSLSLVDFSANGVTNGGTGVNSPTAISGKIDGGISLLGASNQYVTVGTSSTLNPTAETVSAWVKASSFPNAYNTVWSRITGSSSAFQQLFVKSNGKLAIYLQGSGPVNYDGAGTTTLSANTWYYVAFTYSSSAGLTGYVNGSQDRTAAANGGLAAGSVAGSIGQDTKVFGRGWDGAFDEVKVSSVARSAAWLATEYANQSSPPAITGWTPISASFVPFNIY